MEVWKDVSGYEGAYQVSNYGRVRSLGRIETDKNGRRVSRCGKQLKAFPNSSGYMRVQLKRNGIRTYCFVHRLVALHFVENSDASKNKIVNHIDNNYLNNHACNLEWTTYRGNLLHAMRQGRTNRTQEWLLHLRASNEKGGKSVMGTNITTGETVRFVCLNDCRMAGFEPSCVCECCKGNRKTHKGYTWRYA